MVDREATAVTTTGVDSSAGLATRVLTGVLLPFTTVWEISKLVVRRCAGGSTGAVAWIIRLLVGTVRHVGHFVGHFVGQGMTAAASALAAAGSTLWRLSRPLRGIIRWCGRGLSHLAWTVDRVLHLVGRVVSGLLAPVLRRAARLTAWVFVAIAAAIGWTITRAVTFLGRAARLLWSMVTAGVVLATLVLTMLVRSLLAFCRVLLGVCIWILTPLWAVAVAGARVIAALAMGVAWLIARIVGRIAHGLAAVGRFLVGVLAFMAAALWRPLRALGRRAARIVGTGGTAIGRALLAVIRSITSVIAIVMRPLARGIGRGARATMDALEAIVGRISGSVRSSSGRVVQGSLVAFGTARHQARILPRTGTIEALELSDAQGRKDDTDERPLTAVFTATSHQNPYLPPGGSSIEAIVSVSADIATFDERSREAVEIFLLDCSGSMGHPWDKIRALRKATRAALEILPDGVWFAVVRGAETAEVAYPPTNGLVQASPATRQEAVATLATLQPVGGTAIGKWLDLAARLSALRPRAIHHALLLTDGKDEDETAQELDEAVAAAVGRFQCDCRGIGSDWAVSELRTISSALLGSVDIIRQPADMEGDFRTIIDAALARQVEATLQVWVPERANVRFVRQVSPAIEDLTAWARVIDAHTVEIPTGAWTTEVREYHIGVDVPAGPLDAEMLASRVSLMVGGRKHAQALIKASWTDEASLFTPMSHAVAHYTDQTELAQAIQEGLQARRAGQEQRATDKLGRAVQLAARSGRHATSRLLADVVDVEDAMTGRVTLKADVEDADEMALDARSTRTSRSSGSTFDTASTAGRESPTGAQRARI